MLSYFHLLLPCFIVLLTGLNYSRRARKIFLAASYFSTAQNQQRAEHYCEEINWLHCRQAKIIFLELDDLLSSIFHQELFAK